MRTGAAVLMAVIGVAAATVGLWPTSARAAASGWTAYSPLSAETYPVFVGPPWWALALVVLGSALAGAAATLLIVRRSRARGSGRAQP